MGQTTKYGTSGLMTQDATIDFFISYDDADLAWAEWIEWLLRMRGYRTHLEHWDVRPGQNMVLALDQALQVSKRMLALLSPGYLAALDKQPEWATAWQRDPTGVELRLVPVFVRACTPSG